MFNDIPVGLVVQIYGFECVRSPNHGEDYARSLHKRAEFRAIQNRERHDDSCLMSILASFIQKVFDTSHTAFGD